jgi:hypothetical protein
MTTHHMSLAWWLFIRELESMRLAVVDPLTVLVSGPGWRREHRRFDTERALTEFAVGLEEALRASGWNVAGFEAERRSPSDRRAADRSSNDRRRE